MIQLLFTMPCPLSPEDASDSAIALETVEDLVPGVDRICGQLALAAVIQTSQPKRRNVESGL